MSNKENLLKSIEKSGWYLTTEGLDEILAESPNLNSNDLIKKALNCDLRNIGNKSLPDSVLNSKQDSVFQANHVLQLSKLKNIGAPKANESCMTAPPMYRVTLTDGNTNCNALVIDDVNKLNWNTPPGTKLYLHGTIKIKSNLLILNNQVCQVLGGTVDYLVTKWKQTKELSEHVRVMNLTETAPPPWVPFGTRQTNQVDTSKKVFAEENKPETETSTEFSQARQAALAEAMEAKSKITKTFTQTTVDKAQIETTAVGASATSTISSRPYTAPETGTKKQEGKGRKGKGKNMNNLLYDDENDYKDVKDAVKPSAVTLFDLFKTKLDIKDDDKPQTPDEPKITENSFRGSKYNNPRSNPRSNQRNQNRQQNFQNKPREETTTTNKQIYNKDDFNFDLGDTIKVKDLKNNINTQTINSSSTTNTSYKPEPNNYQRNTQKPYNNNSNNINDNNNKQYNYYQQQNQFQYGNNNFRNNNSNNNNIFQKQQQQDSRPNQNQNNSYRNNFQQQDQFNNNNNNYQQQQQDYRPNQNQNNSYRNNYQQQDQFNNNNNNNFNKNKYNNNYRNNYPQNQYYNQ